LIDARSFSSLWYWIAVAAYWMVISNAVIGVPYDLVLRSAQPNSDHTPDLIDMVRINVLRLLRKSASYGLVTAAIAAAGFTILFLLGMSYGMELAQAIFLVAGPGLLVHLLNIRVAKTIYKQEPEGDDLIVLLKRHRFKVQLIGSLSIFITALWGMYHNLVTGPLG
jgi:hypothetical protein